MRYFRVICLLLFVFLLFQLNTFHPWIDSASAAQAVKVYIRADGSVQGTNNILRIGDLYTLVGDVTGPLIVEKDNIVIDGGGHKFTVDYGVGIVLANRYGVTLRNTHIEDVGGYNIDLTNATDCLIVGNTIVGAPSPTLGPIAIKFLHSQRITVKDNTITNFFEALSLDWSSDHTITGNTLTNGILGISIQSSSGCTFRNNHMVNCTFSVRTFPDYAYENDLDTSNTVDGKPIYYWVNAKDQTVPSDAVYIVLVNCTNIRVDGGSPQGINLISTTNSAITNVRMSGRGDGITLLDCSNIGVTNNVLLDHAIGIQLHRSQNNQISANEISNHPTRGITLSNATNNLISGNTIFNNSYAIGPYQEFPSYGTIIESNNFTANDFAITANGDLTVTGNTFEANDQAILFSGGSGCTVTKNTFENNKCALYFGGSSGNQIYLNNFLGNDRQVTDGGVSSTLAAPTNMQSNMFLSSWFPPERAPLTSCLLRLPLSTNMIMVLKATTGLTTKAKIAMATA